MWEIRLRLEGPCRRNALLIAFVVTSVKLGCFPSMPALFARPERSYLRMLWAHTVMRFSIAALGPVIIAGESSSWMSACEPTAKYVRSSHETFSGQSAIIISIDRRMRKREFIGIGAKGREPGSKRLLERIERQDCF